MAQSDADNSWFKLDRLETIAAAKADLDAAVTAIDSIADPALKEVFGLALASIQSQFSASVAASDYFLITGEDTATLTAYCQEFREVAEMASTP